MMFQNNVENIIRMSFRVGFASLLKSVSKNDRNSASLLDMLRYSK